MLDIQISSRILEMPCLKHSSIKSRSWTYQFHLDNLFEYTPRIFSIFRPINLIWTKCHPTFPGFAFITYSEHCVLWPMNSVWPPIICGRFYRHRKFYTITGLWWVTTYRTQPTTVFLREICVQLPVMNDHIISHKRFLPYLMV